MRLLIILCFSLSLFADSEKITKLLPGFAYPLAVNIALPDDYEAAPFEGGYIWAKKEEINDILKDPQKTKYSYFLVFLSKHVMQMGPSEFSGEENFDKELKMAGYTDIQTKKTFWGDYPVFALKAKDGNGREQFMLWLGTSPEGIKDSSVLMIHYHYPLDMKKLSKEEQELLHDFLNNSKGLSQNDALLMYGYDLQESSTTFSKGNIKIKAISEQKGNELSVVIAPLSGNTDIKITGKTVGLNALERYHGRPSVILYGEAIKPGQETEVVKFKIPVIINDVQEYSTEFNQLREIEGSQTLYP